MKKFLIEMLLPAYLLFLGALVVASIFAVTPNVWYGLFILGVFAIIYRICYTSIDV